MLPYSDLALTGESLDKRIAVTRTSDHGRGWQNLRQRTVFINAMDVTVMATQPCFYVFRMVGVGSDRRPYFRRGWRGSLRGLSLL